MASRGKNTVFRVTGIPIGDEAIAALSEFRNFLDPDDDVEMLIIVQSLLDKLSDPKGLSADKQAEHFLKSALALHTVEAKGTPSGKTAIEVIPCCYKGTRRSALLYFLHNKYPGFLVKDGRVAKEEHQVSVGEIDLTISRNYYGFTQLYATPGKIAAE